MMEFLIQFAQPWFLYCIPVIMLCAWYVLKQKKPILYRFPLTDFLYKKNLDKKKPWALYICPLLQALFVALLLIILAQPRLVDTKSKVRVEGIDMMIVLDVSGSMQICDDQTDQRSRLQVAKQEAIKFIDKRENDPIGLVIFGYDAVSRCPLTLDKKILKEIMHETDIGIINPAGTVLSLGMIMAANRLKHSKAANKIMIVLTDGTPSAEDMPAEQAIAVAKQLGIKIYTIGIGYDGVRYFNDPFRGLQAIPGVNKELLHYIANQTGGHYFEAKKPDDMKIIYDTIDMLEKTEYETDIFTNYNDIYQIFVFGAFIVGFIELILSCFVWFVL